MYGYLLLAWLAASGLLSLRRTWVVRGSGVLVAAAGWAAVAMLRGTARWSWIVPVMIGIAGRRSWLVRADLVPLIGEAARLLLLQADGYRIRSGAAEFALRYVSLGNRYGILTFPPASQSKKMVLLKQLMYKKLPPLWPRPKIRI